MTKLLSKAVPTMQTKLFRITAYHHNLRLRRPVLSVLSFLALSLLIGATTVFAVLYTPCRAVTVEGQLVGAVASAQVLERSITQVEEEVSDILGEAYTFHSNVEDTLAFHRKDDIMTNAYLSEALYASVAEIKPAYILAMDGETVGLVKEQTMLSGVLDQIKEVYVTRETQEVFFANDIRVSREYVPEVNEYTDIDFFVSYLQEGVVTEVVYEVQQGDTIRSIASAHNMTTGQLKKTNEGLYNDTDLFKGQLLKTESIVPRLSVCTVDRISYTEEIPSPIRNVEDATMYEGETKVIEQGTDGRQFLIANRTYFNGETLTEEVLQSDVLLEPVETVMAVGTKEKPLDFGTGDMQWPAKGTVLSEYGYRYIFGSNSFHSGIDIAASRGDTIMAADRGKVIFTGYKGSYGNLVIVDHGKGITTYYAHCENFCVSEGDHVEKGQKIATMGSTGRASGVHVHFEVNVNKQKLNPRDFLP